MIRLHADDLPKANQFEHREECHHDFGAAGRVLEQFRKFHAPLLADALDQQLDLFADAPPVFKDFARLAFALGHALKNGADGVDEIEDGHVRLRRLGLEDGLGRFAAIDALLADFQFLQTRRRVLELLVLDKLADEFPTRVFAVVLFFDRDLLIDGQQLAALDVHERGSHDEKLAGDVEVELAHDLDVLDELRSERGKVDLVDVHFLLLDEIKQQVERTLEDLEFDFVFGH